MVRPSRTAQDIASEAAKIAAAESPGIAFSAAPFALTGLPHSEPKDNKHVWTRRNGRMAVTVQAGYMDVDGTMVSTGLPYGTKPRILLHHMCTAAVQNRSAEIDFGDSLAAFMRTIGMQASGGANGSIIHLRKQANRLLRSTLTIDWTGEEGVDRGARLQVVKAWNLSWLDNKTPYPILRKGSSVTLATDFYNEIIAHPVPFRPDVVRHLSGSPLRLDQYIWLTYRMARLDHAITVPWQSLLDQFGCDVADNPQGRYTFKLMFVRHLKPVLDAYPAANVEVVDAGLLLRPSLTSVPFKGVRQLIAAAGDGKKKRSGTTGASTAG